MATSRGNLYDQIYNPDLIYELEDKAPSTAFTFSQSSIVGISKLSN